MGVKKVLCIAAAAVILLTVIFAVLHIHRQMLIEEELGVDIFEGFTAILLCALLIPMIVSELGLFIGAAMLLTNRERDPKQAFLGILLIAASLICLVITVPMFLDSPLFGDYGTLYLVQIAVAAAFTLLLFILSPLSLVRLTKRGREQ